MEYQPEEATKMSVALEARMGNQKWNIDTKLSAETTQMLDSEKDPEEAFRYYCYDITKKRCCELD